MKIDEKLVEYQKMKITNVRKCWDKWHELYTSSTYRWDELSLSTRKNIISIQKHRKFVTWTPDKGPEFKDTRIWLGFTLSLMLF